jgi:phenol hydroxylase P0 protein
LLSFLFFFFNINKWLDIWHVTCYGLCTALLAAVANKESVMGNAGQTEEGTQEGFDGVRRFVRICRERADGFVEFEFALGEPELCVELLLPKAAFEDFCATNQVNFLEPNAEGGDWVQRMNQATRAEYGDTL